MIPISQLRVLQDLLTRLGSDLTNTTYTIIDPKGKQLGRDPDV